MPSTLQVLSPVEALARLDSVLDLAGVRLKLADSEEGKGHDSDRIDRDEAEYRKFLALHLVHPGEEIVPCKIVDEFWHQHILDTRAYHDDCDAIFGSYLHHFPYFGMRGDDDARALQDAYVHTIERYREAFGEPPAETWIATDASKCSRTNCKPQKCR